MSAPLDRDTTVQAVQMPRQGAIVPVRDAVIQPYRFWKSRFYGGIAPPSCPPEASILRGRVRIDRPGPAVAEADITEVAGRHLYCGPLWNHFGHNFADSIHRLWPLMRDRVSHDGLVFVGVEGLCGIRTPRDLEASAPPKLFLELLDLLGFGGIPILFVTRPVRIADLRVPEPGTGLKLPIPRFYAPILAEFQRTLAEAAQVHLRRAPRRLYLGRSHLLDRGGIFGCSHFEAAFRRAGFLSATPEAMSLPLQFGNLMGAETIVFDEGSAILPMQALRKVEADVFMFPRRVTNGDAFGALLTPRVRKFAPLVSEDGLIPLTDRHGNAESAGSLAAFRDPRSVHDGLRALGLVDEDFDPDAFRAAELADLDAARPRSPEVRAGWIDGLSRR
jgi:hypothetical protein